MAKRHNIKGMKVMKASCPSCPFGPDGDAQVREAVVGRIIKMEVSQICHHPALHGKPQTHLCRGARDLQLRVLTCMGFLDEPTDEAFDAKSKELGIS